MRINNKYKNIYKLFFKINKIIINKKNLSNKQ